MLRMVLNILTWYPLHPFRYEGSAGMSHFGDAMLSRGLAPMATTVPQVRHDCTAFPVYKIVRAVQHIWPASPVFEIVCAVQYVWPAFTVLAFKAGRLPIRTGTIKSSQNCQFVLELLKVLKVVNCRFVLELLKVY